MSAINCPHCAKPLSANAVRCHSCKRWINQLSTALFMKQYQQTVIKNWPGYAIASLFFTGVIVAISLQTMSFHWAECLKFAFGHQVRAWLWFGFVCAITYMWVRPLAMPTNNRLQGSVGVWLCLAFIACQYAESWAVPQTLRNYNSKQDTLQQIHLRERINRQSWFGHTSRHSAFNPQPVGTQRVTARINGITGTFGINPQLQHSVIYRQFVDRHLLEMPPDATSLRAGQEQWQPVYLTWQLPNAKPNMDVLTWVQTEGPVLSTVDGILGQDVMGKPTQAIAQKDDNNHAP